MIKKGEQNNKWTKTMFVIVLLTNKSVNRGKSGNFITKIPPSYRSPEISWNKEIPQALPEVSQ